MSKISILKVYCNSFSYGCYFRNKIAPVFFVLPQRGLRLRSGHPLDLLRVKIQFFNHPSDIRF